MKRHYNKLTQYPKCETSQYCKAQKTEHLFSSSSSALYHTAYNVTTWPAKMRRNGDYQD